MLFIHSYNVKEHKSMYTTYMSKNDIALDQARSTLKTRDSVHALYVYVLHCLAWINLCRIKVFWSTMTSFRFFLRLASSTTDQPDYGFGCSIDRCFCFATNRRSKVQCFHTTKWTGPGSLSGSSVPYTSPLFTTASNDSGVCYTTKHKDFTVIKGKLSNPGNMKKSLYKMWIITFSKAFLPNPDR